MGFRSNKSYVRAQKTPCVVDLIGNILTSIVIPLERSDEGSFNRIVVNERQQIDRHFILPAQMRMDDRKRYPSKYGEGSCDRLMATAKT